jgi:hypothetical protein
VTSGSGCESSPGGGGDGRSTAPRSYSGCGAVAGPIRLGLRRAAYVAVALAFASAAVSLFWTLGGTCLLDTLGGSIERLARSRSIGALLLGAAATLVKALAGFLALALVRPWGLRIWARLLSTVNGVVSVILMGWGGANVCVGALVLTGVISLGSEPDKRALVWHVFVWDLWFVAWGAGLAVATVGCRRMAAQPKMKVVTHSRDSFDRAG